MSQKLLLSFVSFCLLLAYGVANARDYGQYDHKRTLIITRAPEGKKFSVDMDYLDAMLGDLSEHAGYYPPQFDTPQDKERAAKDLSSLSILMTMVIESSPPNADLLVRAAHTWSMAHNLDIPGAAERANGIFLRLLNLEPLHPRGNLLYGVFLSGVGQPSKALPYLDKALSLGVNEAEYSLGLTHLSLGNKMQALRYLEAFKRRNPGNQDVNKIIDAIHSGRIQVKKSPS